MLLLIIVVQLLIIIEIRAQVSQNICLIPGYQVCMKYNSFIYIVNYELIS